jgi:hypothetical protein
MAKPQRFPEFEPEVIAAAARRRGGDIDRVATTAVGDVDVRGVRLSSRYGKAHELNWMAEVVEALPERWRAHVVSIFCDSLARAYAVKVTGCRRQEMDRLAEMLSRLFVAHAGGHNGVSLNDGLHTGAFLNPRWRDR